MPKVFSADIKQLLYQAIDKHERETGIRLNQNVPAFFLSLSKEINSLHHVNLKAETMYKHFFLRLRSFEEATIGYSWNYLDGIAAFVAGKEYKNLFPVLKNTVNDIKAAVRRVDFDIHQGSEDDPSKPEFPPSNPAFPATPTIPLQIDGFNNIWVKDESHNPTGTHKDRMAWEIVIFYRNFLANSALKGKIEKIPQLSLISSGCAAIAIQTQLKYYNLPSLKVIIDCGLNEEIKSTMMKLGCEIFEIDLEKEELNTQRILEITENEAGKDLTFGEDLDYVREVYYDWLSYEILNQNPAYCIVPFGSGGLFNNILNIALKESRLSPNHSRRFFGSIDTLRNCHFIGATAISRDTQMDKLYSPFNPYQRINKRLEDLREAGQIGISSRIVPVKEQFLDQTMEICGQRNIQCEPSGLAGLALIEQLRQELPTDEKILVVNTGKLRMI